MSRKGKQLIPLPKGVEVKISNANIVVKGPKGTLTHELIPGIVVNQEGDHLIVALGQGHEEDGNFHGLFRAIINNMVQGTSHGFEKKLEMVGVGYRASVAGHHLDLLIGLSHPTKIPIPEGVHVKVEKNTSIIVTGADKQKIGQFAATVRAVRPPEPYQGKGIRYENEYVRKKAGKAAAAKK